MEVKARAVFDAAAAAAAEMDRAGDKAADNAGRTQIKYMGEYVLNSSGNKDFGIIPEIKDGQKIYKAAPIRLRIGEHDAKTDKGYGEKHIERTERLAQLQQNGYNSARDLVEYVGKDYNAIYAGKGKGLIVVKKKDDKRNSVVYVELNPIEGSEFYDVTGGLVANQRHFKNKKPLITKETSETSDFSNGDGDADATTPPYPDNTPQVPTLGSPSNSLSDTPANESSGRFFRRPRPLPDGRPGHRRGGGLIRTPTRAAPTTGLTTTRRKRRLWRPRTHGRRRHI
jgi:hypothetical protein